MSINVYLATEGGLQYDTMVVLMHYKIHCISKSVIVIENIYYQKCAGI